MLNRIQRELAKLIAQEIYAFAKQSGKEVYRSLKKTQLTPRGKGLPEPVLASFEEAFLDELDRQWLYDHGYTKWRDGGTEKEFRFLVSDQLIDTIRTIDWSNAANTTDEGVSQIQALGGADRFNEAVNGAVAVLFDFALKNICGEYRKITDSSGWRALTPVIETRAAPDETVDFAPTCLFYKSHGTRDETLNDLKLAKRLITGGWFRKGALPSEGPYLA